MDTIRLLILIDSVAEDAGTENQVAELVARIDRARFEVHLCCFEDSRRLRELARYAATAVFPLTSIYRLNGLRQIWRLRRYINRQRIDIVHAFMQKSNIVAVAAARGSGAKAIVAARRNLGYWQTPFYVRLFRCLDRHTTRLLANSEGARRATIEIEGAAPERVDVLYNGVDMERYAASGGDPSVAASLGVPAGARVVGIVAHYRPVKDLGLFLRAAKVVAAEVSDAVFLLVGQGPLRGELGRLAEELGIAEKVFFTDGHGAVPDYLGRMAVGCLCSTSEGFSNALLECMAAGLPVVATAVGGNPEAVEDGVTGYVVHDRDPRAFAAPIIELLRDEATRARLARQSLERCRERFDINAAVRRLEDYYARLASGSGAG
ncbi:MAG: glycosyltransferase [Acidobacteriota bacterium]